MEGGKAPQLSSSRVLYRQLSRHFLHANIFSSSWQSQHTVPLIYAADILPELLDHTRFIFKIHTTSLSDGFAASCVYLLPACWVLLWLCWVWNNSTPRTTRIYPVMCIQIDSPLCNHGGVKLGIVDKEFTEVRADQNHPMIVECPSGASACHWQDLTSEPRPTTENFSLLNSLGAWLALQWAEGISYSWEQKQ